MLNLLFFIETNGSLMVNCGEPISFRTCAYVKKLFLKGKAVIYGGPSQVIVISKAKPLLKKRQ
jgi:hypothetical protein